MSEIPKLTKEVANNGIHYGYRFICSSPTCSDSPMIRRIAEKHLVTKHNLPKLVAIAIIDSVSREKD